VKKFHFFALMLVTSTITQTTRAFTLSDMSPAAKYSSAIALGAASGLSCHLANVYLFDRMMPNIATRLFLNWGCIGAPFRTLVKKLTANHRPEIAVCAHALLFDQISRRISNTKYDYSTVAPTIKSYATDPGSVLSIKCFEWPFPFLEYGQLLQWITSLVSQDEAQIYQANFNYQLLETADNTLTDDQRICKIALGHLVTWNELWLETVRVRLLFHTSSFLTYFLCKYFRSQQESSKEQEQQEKNDAVINVMYTLMYSGQAPS